MQKSRKKGWRVCWLPVRADNSHLTTPTQHVMVGITRSKVILLFPPCCHDGVFPGHRVGRGLEDLSVALVEELEGRDDDADWEIEVPTNVPSSFKHGFYMVTSMWRCCCWPSFILIFSGQIIATSHDLTPQGGLVREIPLFQGNLGWWNIIIWPDFLDFAQWLLFKKETASCLVPLRLFLSLRKDWSKDHVVQQLRALQTNTAQ